MQYIGSTTDTYRYRWNHYKDNNIKAERAVEHMQADLFHGRNGFLEDCTITFIGKTDGADPTIREEYWRWVLKIVSPYRLNTVAQKFRILACLLYNFPRQECY